MRNPIAATKPPRPQRELRHDLRALERLVPAVAELRLRNGVRVVVEDPPRSGMASVSLWIAAGSRHELPEERGATHLLEHVLLRRDDDPERDWRVRVEELGGSYDGGTGRDFLCFRYTLPGPLALEPLEGFLADLVEGDRHFDDVDVETEKAVVLDEVAQARQDVVLSAYEQLHAAVLPPALGGPIAGSGEEIRRLDAQTLRAARTARWTSGLTGVVLCGLAPEDVEPLLAESALLSLRPGRPPAQPDGEHEPDTADGRVGGEVACLGFGRPGGGLRDPRRAAFDVVASFLGRSTASPVYADVRESRGLAYGIDAWHAAYPDAGVQTLLVQTSADRVEETAEAVEQSLAELAAAPPGPRAVDAARAQTLVDRIAEWESTAERIDALGRQVLVPGEAGLDLRSWARAVLEVTPDDVAAVLEGWNDYRRVVAA